MLRKGVRVGILMSGGVDSSVAAYLLHRQGYDVAGITLQLWDYESAGRNPRGERGCCDISHQQDARIVCSQIGIDHHVLDLRERFTKQVVQPYENAYLTGRTPNPCVACNSFLKWGAVLKKARAIGFDFIATGHYAQVIRGRDGIRLERGRDRTKDQSYALWQVPREAIERTLLPLGKWTKREIRSIAKELNLRTADKAESQEVCFIPDSYDKHLRESYPDAVAKIGDGEIVNSEGNIVGHHHGFFTFTIGQRRGLDISDGHGPYYVTDIDAAKNRVIVGSNGELMRRGLIAESVNWLSEDAPNRPMQTRVKVRYNDDEGTPAWIIPNGDNQVRVVFKRPVRAVTPGQSAVWYLGNSVWGGGIIRRAMKDDEVIALMKSQGVGG